MKTVLITGSNGFVGSKFRQFYEKNNFKVLTLGKRENNDFIWDEKRILSIPSQQKIDKVIHCAAVNETQVLDDLRITYDVNVLLTRLLAEFAIKQNIEEFTYLSTFHVYGKYDGKITIDTPPRPLNDYGLTHLISENILQSIFRDKPIKALCLRPTNIYGLPEDIKNFNRWSLVPYAFIKSALEKKEIRLNSSGKQIRNFVHISNVIENTNNKNFEVKNIFSNESLSIIDFARLISNVLKEEMNIDVDIITALDDCNDEKINDLTFMNEENYEPVGKLKEFIIEFARLMKNKL